MIDIIVNESELSFNRLEKEIYRAACEMASKTLAYILEEMDKKLAQERDKARYRHKGQSISHGGVWNVVQALGEKVKEEEAQ